MTILTPTTTKYKNIIHIGDIHVLLLKRHAEFKEVFFTFFNMIKHLSPEDTFIAILGDMFHSKTDLSPESIDLCSFILKECADRYSTIIVPGNHDANLSNKNRLDSLSPVIATLDHKNLFYLKDSGLYGFGNVLFNNMSIFDPPEKYLPAEQIPPIYKNTYDHIVGLYHGVIDGIMTEYGYRLCNPHINATTFDGHHIVLCGDIHRPMDIFKEENEKVIDESELDDYDMSEWEIVEQIN